MYRIAVAGNPNAGKTCIFNNLTGGTQHVGNYPGVTVEFVEGTTRINKEKATVIDLPGTYSLTAYSQEEVVARDFIIEERPDVIIDVVDASNLERNLYLSVQLFELNCPIVIALNMTDVAEKKGLKINPETLSRVLGVKVVETAANKNRGMNELKQACLETIEGQIKPKPLCYSHELADSLPELETAIKGSDIFSEEFSPRWLALKLLEDDEQIIEKVKNSPQKDDIFLALEHTKKHLMTHSGEDAITAVVEARYAIASGAARSCTQASEIQKRMLTERIDAIACNRFLGPIILLGVVYLLFTFVFNFAEDITWLPLFNGEWISPVGLFELFFEFLGNLTDAHIHNPALKSLLKDGIIGGVGGVMSFVPLIFLMFLFVSALEDTGYIARVAFILDRVLRVFGLQGKSILAMIVSGGLGGGGCAVPGVMATRTLREEKDRLVTILVAPMMNCGAKMPVYAMLIAAFFSSARGSMMFLLWALSWVFALFSSFILRKWVIKGEQTPFVMELPVYHLPTFMGVMMHTWNRTWMYIKKAGTVILGINVILWSMMYFPRQDAKPFEEQRRQAEEAFEKTGKSENKESKTYTDYTKRLREINDKEAQSQLRNSIAGRFGTALVPVSRLAGFEWRENIALIGGFAAKEVVLGTLGTAYSMGEVDAEQTEPLSTRLAKDKNWNPLRAFVLMLFVMIYAPCFVTVVAIKRETGSWKWALFSTVYSTTLGLVVAVAVYQIGMLLF